MAAISFRLTKEVDSSFFGASIVTIIFGTLFFLSNLDHEKKLNLQQAFLLTSLSWVSIAIFGSLPFIFSSSNLNFTDAFFESISGITTTGSTVIINLDKLPEGILIWRSFLQWFGGIGIIVLAIAILPTLQIGGMQLLHMEHDDPYEKTIPKVGQFVIEIFSIYLNRAFLGSGAYGFEAASQRYFSKSARDVNPAEAAMLAGLLKAPSAANPIRNLSRAQSRGNLIVGLMKDQGYLTDAQAIIAKNNPAMLSQTAVERAGEYFADWVLGTAPEFIIKDANADVIIETTFDKNIQFLTEQALDVVFQKLKPGSEVQAGVIVMSPDGAVRAMIGGRKTGLAGSFNRATQALRQTGSAFKPMVYAAAYSTLNGIAVDFRSEDP